MTSLDNEKTKSVEKKQNQYDISKTLSVKFHFLIITQNQIIGKPNNLKSLRAIKQKGLNRIVENRLRSPMSEGGEP